MTDLSKNDDLISYDLMIFWDGFQDWFDAWIDACGPTCNLDRDPCDKYDITRFCRRRFSYDECETYCVDNNYCSLFWTKQAKICCEKCDQTCTSMGESVSGECSSSTTTSMTTTTEDHVSTITFPTSNGTSYTKQPFGKSPLISH